MDTKIILQVALNDDNSLEVQVGSAYEAIPQLMLVGILEQVKTQILNNDANSSMAKNPSKNYDA